jgi:hypothetical protein
MRTFVHALKCITWFTFARNALYNCRLSQGLNGIPLMVKRFVRSNISLSGRLGVALGLWFSRHAPGRHVNSGSAAIPPSPSPPPPTFATEYKLVILSMVLLMVFVCAHPSPHNAPYTVAASAVALLSPYLWLPECSTMIFGHSSVCLDRTSGYTRCRVLSAHLVYGLCTDRAENTVSNLHCWQPGHCLAMAFVSLLVLLSLPSSGCICHLSAVAGFWTLCIVRFSKELCVSETKSDAVLRCGRGRHLIVLGPLQGS